MISTLSCSTSLRVALTALSGVASDESLMNSIFLPPAMPLCFLHRQLDAAMPSCAGDRERPLERGQPADLDGLLRRRQAATAREERRQGRASRPARGCSHGHRPFLGRSVAPRASGRLPARRSNAPARSVGPPPSAGRCPQTEQPVGRKQHDRQEHDADHEVEALAGDDVDGEVLHEHEEDGADERRRSGDACRRARR